MPDSTRTFVALAVPQTLEPRLTRLRSQLADELPAVRWAESPFHLTIAFLGDVSHTDLSRVCSAIGGAASAFGPMELSLAGVGVFPNPERPRVIWAGVTGPGLDTLTALQAAVAEATARAGYPSDAQPFHPHVTLGRFKTVPRGGGKAGQPGPPISALDPADLLDSFHRRRRWSAGPFTVTEVVTYSSNLTREGPDYAALARARLAARKSG